MKRLLFPVALPLILLSCACKETKPYNTDDLTNLKNEFIRQIQTENDNGGALLRKS